MSTPISMPKQGQSVESCVLLAWLKKKGDRVNKGEQIFSYETDKATFEFASPAAGVLLDTFFSEQDDVPVHSIVAVIGEPGESAEQYRPRRSEGSPQSPARDTAPAPDSAAIMQESAAAGTTVTSDAPGTASPRAQRKADKLGIDLSSLTGTGPGGRILERDVLAGPQVTRTAAARRAAESLTLPAGHAGRVRASELVPGADSAAAYPAEDGVTEVTLTTIRRIIGSRMLQSLQQSAQLTMNAYADASALIAWRKKAKAQKKKTKAQDITITDLIALAAVRTLSGFPELNAICKNERVFRCSHVHLAVAVDTPRGLMVPVVQSAGKLSLEELSAAIKKLATQCREGSVNPDLLTGGTITITNLGIFGIDSFTPILNPPQVAILGINAIAPRPVQDKNGRCAVRPHIGFSLTIDHRVVDGAPGARFLKTLCDHIVAMDFIIRKDD